MADSHVISVRFLNNIMYGEQLYYFGSLAAIYERFTVEEIGCTLKTLWASDIAPQNPKVTRRCIISKHLVIRKPHSKK